MRPLIFKEILKVNTNEALIAKNIGKFQPADMAGEPISDESWRCRIVRAMLAGTDHGSQTRFVARLDGSLTVARWNNFEGGKPLSKEIALLLVQKIPGLTLDWLYLGNRAGLSLPIREGLEAAEKALTSAEGKARKR